MVVQFHTVWLWMRLLDYKCGSNEKPLDKTNKMTVRPAKTQISLGIRPVWSESSLCAQWIVKVPSFLHADSEDSLNPILFSLWCFLWESWFMCFSCIFFCLFEAPHDKTIKVAYAPSEDSDQPGHPPSLIKAFAVHMKKAWILSYPLNAQRRLWSDWEDAQADMSLRWAHMPFCWFYHEAAHFAHVTLSLFSSSWWHELAVACDCGTPWNFLST